MSDSSMITESTWGPCESASKSQRAAQPYRLQKANKVVACGPDGLVTPDSHRTSGVIVLRSGCRLPATIIHGSRHLSGKDHNGLPRLSGP